MHAIFALVILFASLFIPPVQGAPDRETCTGYAEPRVFVDSQAWWVTTPGKDGKDFGHLHTDLCFPFRQQIRGIVPFDIRITMHHNPGKLTALTMQIGGSGQYVAAQKKFKPPLTCAAECEWWIHFEADTRGFSNDGWQEFRIRPKIIEPDGNELIGSTSYQAYLANGKPIKSYRDKDYMQGKAWYSKIEYAQARVTGGYPYGALVSGKWTLAIACDASSKPVTGCAVTIDPLFHQGNMGAVQLQRDGPFKGNVVIDTTQFSNGQHFIVIKTDVRAVEQGSTLSGILKLPFLVNNP